VGSIRWLQSWVSSRTFPVATRDLAWKPFSTLHTCFSDRIASIFIAMSFLGVMWWANSITSKILTTAALGSSGASFYFFPPFRGIRLTWSILTLGFLGLLVAFWFIDHAGMLRYYVLLMGVLSCWYVLFDVMDDFGRFSSLLSFPPIYWDRVFS
jgi:hypothetical protein